MTVEQVLTLLDSALRSEQGFIEDFVARRELLRAVEAQARFKALAAFREVILERLERGSS